MIQTIFGEIIGIFENHYVYTCATTQYVLSVPSS